MNKAYLLIGGNMGDRKGFLAKAREQIHLKCGWLVHQSALYETAAWGHEEQDAFLNQALEVNTTLEPEILLRTVLLIEEDLGRKREMKYGPRIIDIDILLFNDVVLHQKDLTIPHPQLQNRRFVLVPLAEIAPTYIHPIFKKNILQLLEECPDTLDVQKIS